LRASLALLFFAACATRTPPSAPEPIANLVVDPCSVDADAGLPRRYPRVRIVDAGQLISTPNFRADADATARLRAAGIPEADFETVFARIEESGWPPKLASFDERIANPALVAALCPRRISPPGERRGDVLVIVVAGENQHMPDGWRPDVDIYMTFEAHGLAPD
jgi:hypothetical protein